jgi:hypothetical protein
MKKFYFLMALVTLMVQIFGQTPQDRSSLIHRQDYLAPMGNSIVYSDSLEGFDEAAVQAAIKGHGVYGAEYLNYINMRKREFIKEKYHLNMVFTNPVTNVISKNIGSSAVINVSPCVNEGFESTSPGSYVGTSNSLAVQGWTITSQNGVTCPASSSWTPGSPEFSIRATPILSFPSVGTITHSPLGGTVVAQLNSAGGSGYTVTRLSQTFPVTSSNSLFRFAYAGFWQDGSHLCCEQPSFKVIVRNSQGIVQTCTSLDLSTSPCPSNLTYTNSGGYYWTNWSIKSMDLTPYIGTSVTIDVINSDCIYGGHYGCVLFDAQCGSSSAALPCNCTVTSPGASVSFCAGTSQAIIQAPLGYTTYSWSAPFGYTIPASQGSLSSLSVANPTAGSVFTVYLNNGTCMYLATYTLVYTTVSIVGLGTTPTCSMSAGGSATVVGNGSGTGYNYAWINSTNSVVSTASVASNLVPGVYTVTISATPGCGTAAITATVGTAASSVNTFTQNYCSSQGAYLYPGAGSNYQWYNGTVAIGSGQGGTASSYTVSSPFNGAVYRLGYVTPQGCRDSIIYTLSPTNSGFINVSSNSVICPGGNNGQAVFNLYTSGGAPMGMNAYYVTSTGTATPAYNSSLVPTGLYTYTAINLSANGTYSVKVYDGSCYYGATFTVNTLPPFNFTLTPANNPTLCPGNSIAASAIPPGTVASAYTYSWSPTQFLAGNMGIYANTIITPTTAPGVMSTYVYSVTVTYTATGCKETRTISVNAASPITPSIAPIPALCSNDPTLAVTVFPMNGNFSTSPFLTSGGILNPALATPGVNSFTYSNITGTCVAANSATFLVNQVPTILVTGNTSLCIGQTTTLTATGANSYNWSTGSTSASIVLSPLNSSTILVSGTSAAGCTSSTIINITADPMPVVSISGSSSICAGQTLTLTASGAQNYNWNTGSNAAAIIVTPPVTTVYIVTGINSPVCQASYSTLINVLPSPTLLVSPDVTLCPGGSALITASGANSYLWSNGATSAIIGVNPVSTTAYVVTGSNGNSICAQSRTVTVTVDPCTGINNEQEGNLRIFPNPVTDILTVINQKAAEIKVYNELGMLVIEKDLKAGTNEVNVTALSNGVYFIKTTSEKTETVTRFVKIDR